jgi:hypothetical protein
MSPAPRRHRAYELARNLAHLLVVVVGWVGFVWLWLLVAARPWDSQGLTWLILGSLVLMPLLTGAWVLHNRSIHRRKGDRQAVSPVDMGYAHDWHGRAVQADWDVLRRSRSVIVEVKGDHKHYLVGHTEEPGLQVLAPARTSGSRHVAMQDSPLE